MSEPVSKVCLGCGVDKPFDQYHKHPCCKFGLNSRCRSCTSVDARQRYQALTAGGQRHPYRNAIKRRHILKKKFGMTDQAFVTMKARQEGLCAICRKPETGTSGVKRTLRELAVDHDHTTGAVRGLLCHKCNAALGCFNDNIDLLEAAKEYLKGGLNGARY